MFERAKIVASRFGTTARALLTQLRVRGAEGDEPGTGDDDAEGFDDAEVVQPHGLLARPALSRTLQALIYRDGNHAVVIAIQDKGLPVSTLEAGATQLYGGAAPIATVTITAAGEISVTSKSGQKIKLNGAEAAATHPVAYETSGTAGHFHLANGSSGGGRAPGSLTAGPWAVTGVTSTDVDSIAVGQGSQNVLVPDTQ